VAISAVELTSDTLKSQRESLHFVCFSSKSDLEATDDDELSGGRVFVFLPYFNAWICE